MVQVGRYRHESLTRDTTDVLRVASCLYEITIDAYCIPGGIKYFDGAGQEISQTKAANCAPLTFDHCVGT